MYNRSTPWSAAGRGRRALAPRAPPAPCL